MAYCASSQRMTNTFTKFLCLLFLFAFARALAADSLLLRSGDRLNGSVVRADSSGVVFHNASLGDVHVAWHDVQWLTSDAGFVAVTNTKTWTGTFTAQGEDITLMPASGTPVPLHANDLLELVSPEVYRGQLEAARLPWWRGWQGTIAAGFSLVSATQSSNNYTTNIALRRQGGRHLAEPPRSTTMIGFQGSYGSVSQPNSPTVLTSIYSANFEHDQNLSPRFFVLGRAEFAHNFAQGLQLQQTYGPGLGWKPINNAVAQLDLTAGLHFTHQTFLTAAPASFLASDFSEEFRRRLPGGMTWTEQLQVSPAVTKGNAYQAAASTGLVVPMYKQLSFNIRLADSYLGNPQAGFRHNSLQFSSGLQLGFP